MTRAKLRSDKHWTSAFLLLTDYGLSARFDQTNLTGLWTLEHDFDHYFRSCYRGDRVRAMAQGQIAEIWLIGHRARELRWDGKHYTLEVARVRRGLQVVQFQRQEHKRRVPLAIHAPDATQVAAQID